MGGAATSGDERGGTDKEGSSSSSQAHEQTLPLPQASLYQKSEVLNRVFSVWGEECGLAPHLEWQTDASGRLFAQLTFHTTYKQVGLFSSEHLTLFSVLVTECMSKLMTEAELTADAEAMTDFILRALSA